MQVGTGSTRWTARGSALAPGVRRALRWVSLLALIGLLPAAAVAQDDDHECDDDHEHGAADHHAGLHFTHPMIAESVSPDTKIRLDHQYFEFRDGDREHSAVLEAEYAFARGVSLEVAIPYSYTESAFGNFDAALKFANYAFERAGVLLGYGVELGFPTNGDPVHEEGPVLTRTGTGMTRAARRGRVPGAGVPGPIAAFSGGGGAGVEGELGTDEWEVAPFLNAGLKRGRWELVGWTHFEIPFNQAEQEEVETELAYNVSALLHATDRLQALLELDGASGISGESSHEDVLNLSPGLRVRLSDDRPLVLGGSVGFPISAEEPFDLRLKASLFWHF